MVKLKSHKIKHTPLCDLLSVLVKHWFPVFHHRIFKSKHLPVAFYLKVKVVVQICLDCPVHLMQFLFALTQYHHVIHVSHGFMRSVHPRFCIRSVCHFSYICIYPFDCPPSPVLSNSYPDSCSMIANTRAYGTSYCLHRHLVYICIFSGK